MVAVTDDVTKLREQIDSSSCVIMTAASTVRQKKACWIQAGMSAWRGTATMFDVIAMP